MKKILFLLLICFIKLNAYEYLVYNNNNGTTRLYKDVNNEVKIDVVINGQHNTSGPANNFFWSTLSNIKFNTINYIKKFDFDNILKNDLLFLNDLYKQATQQILNYYYNENKFSSTNYINYENFQILYNDDGLAVESIVGGVWKGLYDTPENSGFLYDKENNILYDNGQVASLFARFWYALTGNVSKTLKVYYISMLGLNVFILIVAVYLVKVLLGLVIKWITTVINNTKVNVNLGAQKRW